MGIVSPLDLRSFVRLFIAVAGAGHIINIYPSPLPSPDLTVAWSQTGAGHGIVDPGPGIREAAAAMFCIRGDWRVRVMLFVTDIPGGADGGGEMFNVVQHLLFTQAWPALLTHSYYTHTDLSC